MTNFEAEIMQSGREKVSFCKYSSIFIKSYLIHFIIKL